MKKTLCTLAALALAGTLSLTTAYAATSNSVSLPAKIAESGQLTVALTPQIPPFEYRDPNGQIVGLDVDVINAVAKQLGVKAKINDAGTFDSLIPAVRSGRYDLAISSITDTKIREKQVTFIDYLSTGTGVLVQKGNPKNVTDMDSLCGLKAATTQGSTQQLFLEAQSKKCVAEGKSKIDISLFPSVAVAQLQLKSGRVDLNMRDYPIVKYIAGLPGSQYSASPIQIHKEPFGIAVRKSNKQLALAIQSALNELIANGTMASIFAKYDLSSIAIDKATINGAVR